ncbi:RteC domain-containing protein [Sphingobacterium hungaricum]|uniref:RteC protein n=1 Tax=Sphingobacterium hungaricum TaxID=2082723 RepID=A0A928UWZ0_9SPHI|nr:RteC domain-containing protein [Sphingobacterium hungaricum]MBE8714826.1 hypothetical protein [Sphingobacterium hungaricum]
MKNHRLEQLYEGMLHELRTLNDTMITSIIDFPKSLNATVRTMDALAEWSKSHPFDGDREEIYFFKYIKPRFQCWHLYIIELYHIISAAPIDTDKIIQKYYESELKVIDRYFKRYALYYQYYYADENARDKDFFLSRNHKHILPELSLFTKSNSFSSSLDYLFAKFKALEMLRNCIIRIMKEHHRNSEIQSLELMLKEKKQWWSGNKIELVELAYGLYHSKRINGGNAEVGEIITWLEMSLNVDLKQSYRMFLDISRRKLVSHTKFIDEMQTALNSHIQNNYGPQPTNNK